MTDSSSAPRQFVSIAEFAVRWKIHYRTVQVWVKKGLPKTRVGRTVCIIQPDADDWVKRQLDSATATFSMRDRDARRRRV